MLTLDTCALTSLQVTYKAPYVYGIPTSADLNLGFTRLKPTYKDSFK